MAGQVTTTLKGYTHASLSMVITRADGTVEDHGVVAQSVLPAPKRSILTTLGDFLCRKR
uniref:hypothetical protein n=1 Tax=uncultured Sphingomonas sp. TaxID=158754 RepID=UPI0035CABF82